MSDIMTEIFKFMNEHGNEEGKNALSINNIELSKAFSILPNGVIESLIGEIESLKNQVHNLNLYLSYVERELPSMITVLNDEFSGMPGYTGAEE